MNKHYMLRAIYLSRKFDDIVVSLGPQQRRENLTGDSNVYYLIGQGSSQTEVRLRHTYTGYSGDVEGIHIMMRGTTQDSESQRASELPVAVGKILELFPFEDVTMHSLELTQWVQERREAD